jgi:1-acyl-sn-glycerol-3-phosphate acyltransferase
MALCWRNSDDHFFFFCERVAICFFAKMWHGCWRDGPDPLPAKGPAILIANHPTQADPAFLIATCKRPPRFLQAREYYRVFLLRYLFDLLGSVPVARNGQDVSAVRLALQRLQAGLVLGIFPEGDLTEANRNRKRQAKSGAALLALRAHVPVFPAHIEGGPQGRPLLLAWLWPSSGVRVIYGEAIDLSGYSGRPITRQLLREVTDLFMQSIAELRPTSHKEAPLRRPTAA